MAVPGSRVNRPGALFVWHMEINALFEEHGRALRVSVQGGNVHKRRAVFRTLKDARLELVSEQLDYRGVTVLRGQVHGRAVQMVGYRGRGPHPEEILHQRLVALRARYVEGCLTRRLKSKRASLL